MGHIRISFAIGLVVILAACVAPRSDLPQIDPELAKREALIQRKMVLESAIELDIRLAQIARPMWIAAAPLCGKRISPTFGFYYTNQHEWGGEWLRAAEGCVSKVVEIRGWRNLRVTRQPPNRRLAPPRRSRHEEPYRDFRAFATGQ